MLSVINLAGQSEAIGHYSNFELSEELNGALTLSFSSFFHADNYGHDLIEEQGIVEYEGYTFRIKQLKTTRNQKQVSAISTYFDNVGKRKYDTFGGTHTLNEFLDYALADTGWTYTNVDVTSSAFVPNFGHDNVVKLIDTLLTSFDCEMKIEANNTLIFAKQIGADNDAQYRYGHNIKALSENIDTTKLATYIEGYGADGLKVVYTSPNESTFGLIHAEPVNDERYLIADNLLERIKQEIVDYPETAIELDAIELQEKEIGERVWLIHEKLGIEYQTRIMSKKTRYPKTLSSVVLGNRLQQSLSDLFAEQSVAISENQKQTRSKFEQTDSMIALTVTQVDDVDNRLKSAESSITINADSITSKVSQTEIDNSINTLKTNDINPLAGRVSTAESSITQNATDITSKVSQTDYNGNTIASMINQSATTIDIQASKINLTGAVTVLSDITGNLGTITTGTIDIYENIKVGNGVYLRGSGDKRVQFNTSYVMELANGDLGISSLGYIKIGSFTKFDGQVDFTGSTVNWGSNKPVAVWG